MGDMNKCECGCGSDTATRFVKGHNGRKKFEEQYAVVDAGYATPCWVWQCERFTKTGYGRMRRVESGSQLAHRRVYERLVGPIEKGLELDHLCRNRPCINPDHLEPVTHAENCRRGPGGRPRSVSDAQIVEMREHLACGLTMTATAELFGVSRGVVRRYAKG
jgi:hypothetical protein